MKNYLKPYTACTKVEFESLLASESDGKGKGGGGHNGGFNQGCPPCPPSNPSTGQPGSVKAGTPYPAAKEDYFTNFED